MFVLWEATYRASQCQHGWTEDTCLQIDELAQEDLHDIATSAERARYSD